MIFIVNDSQGISAQNFIKQCLLYYPEILQEITLPGKSDPQGW